ncbi:LacI family DNA-binding transcriptional regulator [Bifidobacterium sp. CP2]|uniref:LacI family DNA-binding transcriptional regulator n=1 Tax=Bifidobacterium sp. CP2 TaxID=2809025 RepID=UPI001BDD1A2F|nr:LacI family DNA-binding transcriptional regulator [Bifidobacterium sp. CP2]MBT1180639.1 LacI family DNA-binding transcriptional regulator [Bifidobacterium sp. CP2]
MSEATITDVAKAAGVAASTVSRALNGGNVKAETRERIIQFARQMGYRNGTVAAAPVPSGDGNSRGNIAVLVTDIGNYYFTDIFKGLFSVAQNAKYRLFVTDIDVSTDRGETIQSVIGASEGQLLVSPRLSDAELRRYCDPATTVFTNRQVEGYSCVGIDDASGILQAVRHLASLGHRTIAYVSGAGNSYANRVRCSTCVDAAKSFGMDCIVIGPFEPSYAGGVNAGDALLLEQGITGVVAFNDLVASGVMGRLQERGVDIPGEMSVIGVDDSVLSRVVRPQLTTIDVRQERMGALAMQMLINKIESLALGDDDPEYREPRVELVPEILVTRESTGIAPVVEPPESQEPPETAKNKD